MTAYNYLDENSCRILGAAIAAQAFEDYVNGQRALRKPTLSAKMRRYHQREVKDCLTFFESAWFDRLTRGIFDHEALIERLNEIVVDPTIKVVKFR